MNLLFNVLGGLLIFALGGLLGFRVGRKKVFKDISDYAISWKNTAMKQAKTINDINERLQYYTVGELAGLYEYLKDAEDAEDSDVVLGLIASEGEFIEWKTEIGE